jgi:signal transduction histidine kinase
MASHELRNPVGTLLFAAAALMNDAVRSDAHRLDKVATTIRTNSERLAWLIQNLQRLARFSDPLDVPSQQQVELYALASEVARQLEEMATAKGVTIRVVTGLPMLFVDPARLELILLNLVSNAIKYSDPAKPESFVEVAPYVPAQADGVCGICVRDNGLGIAEADRVAIFDRFFRAHAHLDSVLGVTGTGLGLAIAVDCVQALSGSITCESAVGEGTTFFITLPSTPPTQP